MSETLQRKEDNRYLESLPCTATSSKWISSTTESFQSTLQCHCVGGEKRKKKKKHRAKTTGHCKCVQRKKKIKICKNFQCFLTYHKETKVGKVNFFPSLLLSLNINRRSIPNQQESLLSLTTPTTCLLQLLFSRKDSINQHLHGLVTCNECKQRQKSTGLEYSMNQW